MNPAESPSPGTSPAEPVRRDQNARAVIARWRSLCSQVIASHNQPAGPPSVSPVGRPNVLSAQQMPPNSATFAPLCSAGNTHASQSRQETPCRTLIACSGGADSAALALILAFACRNNPDSLALAHIQHDMRPDYETLADMEYVQTLGEHLGIPVSTRTISCFQPGTNVEAHARTLRYAALHEIAREHECPVIATAHHADDQLETMLMRLFRGSGPRGLAGIAPIKHVDASHAIIRPMLGITHQNAIELCKVCHVSWQHDTTNDDVSRSRAFIRHRLVPIIRDEFPSALSRASDSASLHAQADQLVSIHAAELLDRANTEPGSRDRITLLRLPLKDALPLVLGQLIRDVACELSHNAGMDRITSAVISQLVTAIKSNEGHERTCRTGPVEWQLTKNDVSAKLVSTQD